MTLDRMNDILEDCKAFDKDVNTITKSFVGGKVTDESLGSVQMLIYAKVQSYFLKYPRGRDLSVSVSFNYADSVVDIAPLYKNKEIVTALPKETLGDVYQVVLLGIVGGE